MTIVWLASYPKSGNTWFRALLTNYLRGGPPASINVLVGGWTANKRRLFNELVGLDSSELTAEELLRHRPTFHAALAETLPSPAFVKAHEAFLPVPALCGGTPTEGWLFSGVEAAAVYLVRNPLDVAVSYAHHRCCSIDEAIERMNDPDAVENMSRRGLYEILPQPLTTWSGHVSSWLGQQELPMHVVKYEDLATAPAEAFDEALHFIERHCPDFRAGAGVQEGAPQGAKQRTAALSAAVDHAAFHRLQVQEARDGFQEKMPEASSFFRAGVAGGWRKVLTAAQVYTLVEAHGAVMAQLGYRAEAQAFLDNADAKE